MGWWWSRDRDGKPGGKRSGKKKEKTGALEEWTHSALERSPGGLVETVSDAVSVSPRKARESALPFVSSCAATLAVHSAVLKGCQVASAAVLRVSCATPVLSTLVGGTAVCLASVASGSVARALQQPDVLGRKKRHGGGDARGLAAFPTEARRAWALLAGQTTMRDALADAALGLFCFGALGGRLRAVLASDVLFPGANASASMPAVGASYATKFQRTELLRMLRQHGCHHCGKKSGPVIADHMPPNLFVDQMKRERGLRAFLSRARWNGKTTQRFYPQCTGCSQKQSSAVKKNRKALVLNLSKWHPHYFAGPFVALRTYDGKSGRHVMDNVDALVLSPLERAKKKLWKT